MRIINITCFIKQVFSDEFETEGRSFADGEDSRWTALDKNDCKYHTHMSSFAS